MKRTILLIDNYDSFTYNLYQYLCELGASVTVRRNDEVTLSESQSMEFSHLVISPGPGGPETAGVTGELLTYYSNKIPVLGVCLGHQALAYVFGGKVIRAPRVMHGKTSPVYHDNKTLYHGLSNPFIATRYHSLIVSEDQLPDCFEISSYTSEGEIMGIRLKNSKTEGVQFHPESILTIEGKKLLLNFLEEQC